MFLSAGALPAYLASRGIVPREAIVDGPFPLFEMHRRNRNFAVHLDEGRGVFVKQVQTLEPQALATLAREAVFYAALRDGADPAGLRAFTPALRDYDAARAVLTVDLVPGAESI